VLLSPQLQVSLDDPRFVVDGLGEVHRVARVRGGLSAALRLSP